MAVKNADFSLISATNPVGPGDAIARLVRGRKARRQIARQGETRRARERPRLTDYPYKLLIDLLLFTATAEKLPDSTTRTKVCMPWSLSTHGLIDA